MEGEEKIRLIKSQISNHKFQINSNIQCLNKKLDHLNFEIDDCLRFVFCDLEIKATRTFFQAIALPIL